MVLYKNIRFYYEAHDYYLDTNNDITQICGDSATGKTYMINALKGAVTNGISLKVDDQHPILIFDGAIDRVLNVLPTINNSLVVIDNFDEMVTNFQNRTNQNNIIPTLDTFSNQYIIIARGTYQIPLIGIECLCTLECTDNKITFEYINKSLRRAYGL